MRGSCCDSEKRRAVSNPGVRFRSQLGVSEVACKELRLGGPGGGLGSDWELTGKYQKTCPNLLLHPDFSLLFKHIACPLQELHKPQYHKACSWPPDLPLSSVPPWCLAPSPVGGSPEMRAVHFL